ncbi:hypothetical protein WYO_0470 [Methylobacterium sp. GXF4]|nr:hypothetical protein WYO_0470 [Methylobacterium sp. GXF4]
MSGAHRSRRAINADREGAAERRSPFLLTCVQKTTVFWTFHERLLSCCRAAGARWNWSPHAPAHGPLTRRAEPARHVLGIGARRAAKSAGLMTHVNLEQPAELTLWPGHVPARVAEMRSFTTLHAALDAAAEAIDGQDAIPWIITDSGDILASPKLAHPSATAARTFSACRVMPFLLLCRLPCRYRLLPPLAGPNRRLPCLHRRSTAPFTPRPDPATPPPVCCAICAVREGYGHEELQGPTGCQSLPASLPAVCHELGGSHHTH